MTKATKKLKITQVKSSIGHIKRQKLTLKALGITKMNHSVLQSDTPCVRGMIVTVKHLVNVQELGE